MKEIKLNTEQKAILEKMTIRQLEFFSQIAQNKNFPEFARIINMLVDIEKEKFLGENEYDEKRLVLDHAYSRGSIAGLIQMLRLISVSQHELEKRTEKE